MVRDAAGGVGLLMPARLRTLGRPELDEALQSYDTAAPGSEPRDVERALVKHYLALMEQLHPGHSVELRVPPYAAIQCIEGTRHARGTPPAVVEATAPVFIGLARGRVDFADARADGRVTASGQRSDLAGCFPL